jgi:DNA polymerase-1
MNNKPFTGKVVFDFETLGLEVWRHKASPFLLGIEDEKGNVLLARPGTKDWQQAKGILADPSIEKIGWNVKYDLSVALHEGMQVNGTVHDGMLMCYMNYEYEPNLKLKSIGKRYFDIEADEEKFVKSYLSALRRKGKADANYSDIPKAQMDEYLEKDLDLTMMTYWKFGHVAEGPQRRVYDIERELIPNIVETERWGTHIDIEYCKRQLRTMKPRMAALELKLYDLAGVNFNLNSPIQLGGVLESLNIDTGVRGVRGEMSAGKELLRPFKDNEFVSTLVEWRSLNKIGGTYFESFLENHEDGIIHPSYWPFGQEEDGGIKTGRMSCTKPAFQTIPGGGRGENTEMLKDPGFVRRAITPRPGYVFLFGDYKQIEFVIFACSAGDEGILEDLRNGVDFHTANAYRIFGRDCMAGKTEQEVKRIRFQAKELNFSFIFGMGTTTYAQRAGISVMDARNNKAKFFSEVPAARDFLMRSQADLIRDGYVQDQFGRRYHVPQERAYKAANALCQGPAALVMKNGTNKTCKLLKGIDAHPFLLVHDEVGLEVKRELVWDVAHIFKEGMEDLNTFPVPITMDFAISDKSWADKKKLTKEEAELWKPKRKIFIPKH